MIPQVPSEAAPPTLESVSEALADVALSGGDGGAGGKTVFSVSVDKTNVSGLAGLTLAIPHAPVTQTAVETHGASGDTFFVVFDDVAALAEAAEAAGAARTTGAGGRIAVLWDASYSRRGAKLDREKEVLGAFLADVSGEVDLIAFSNSARPPVTFPSADALIAALDEVEYDGGTSFSALPLASADYATMVLVSDGFSTVEAGELPLSSVTARVHVLNNSPQVCWKRVALDSGGVAMGRG